MRFWILIISIIGTNTFGGTIDPRVSDQKHKDYGAKFKNVVRIKGDCFCEKKEKGHEFMASAVVIKPNWALTAAHVVKDGKNVEILIGDKKFPVETRFHKDFENDNYGNFDIALCRSKKDFEMSFYPELYKDNDETGKVASIAGYGLTGTFLTGAVRGDGIKRAGSNLINRVEKTILICTLDDKRTELEFLIASGDSGGGLFIGNKLAAINSFVMAADKVPDSNYGDESGHTRVSLFIDWIEETIKEMEREND